jgi:hypothetical protein
MSGQLFLMDQIELAHLGAMHPLSLEESIQEMPMFFFWKILTYQSKHQSGLNFNKKKIISIKENQLSQQLCNSEKDT